MLSELGVTTGVREDWRWELLAKRSANAYDERTGIWRCITPKERRPCQTP